MKLAAIDIGSNAMRLQIVQVYEDNDLVSFKKLEYLRFPLRLGREVFKKGIISKPVIEQFTKLMQTFRLLTELYEVEGYCAVATSAMREANNGKIVRDLLMNNANIDIQIISGEEEASILNKSILPYLSEGQTIHIDVGGGSTELNLYNGKKLIDSCSLKMGSVRKTPKVERVKIYKKIDRWIKKAKFSKSKSITSIGTGGNINKLFNLSRSPKGSKISLVELKATRAYVREFSNAERISILKLNNDRADVIIPASEIYIKMMESVGSDNMLVPGVGLKDGIIYELYERTTNKDINRIEFLQEF